jgi:predicted aspartyl protease
MTRLAQSHVMCGRFGITTLLLLIVVTPVAHAEPAPGPPDEAVVVSLPFIDTGEPNRVIVDLAREGNRPLQLILDTGATFTTLTPLAARALGVTVRPHKSSPYRRGTSLGRDLQFWVDTTSSDTGSRTGWEYGLLGGNFLEKYVVEFDFRARTVRFIDPKKFRVPKVVDAENETIVPLRIVSGRPIAKIGMNGKTSSVLLDTGAHNPLILSGKAARKLDIDVDALPPFGFFWSVRGRVDVNLYESDSFTFGGFEMETTPVIVAPKGWYNQGTNTDSVAGYDTLSQFTVRIDYPRERMWLRRERSETTFMGVSYARTREVGLFLHPTTNSYSVIATLPDSPAARFGLVPGDALIAVNQDRPPDLEKTMARISAGESIAIVRQVGEGEWERLMMPAGTPLDQYPPPDPEVFAGEGERPDVGAPQFIDDLTPSERETLRAEAAASDANAVARFEERKNESLYVLVEGGWMLVSMRERRRGPSDGVKWVTFEEMQQIEKDRATAGE